MEIVFVSSDKDEKAFNEYIKEMPWKAIPFSDRERKNKLSNKFKVNGIPTFVILDVDGSLITDGGRAAVMKDPTGTQFPWRPKSVLETLTSASFLGKDGKTKSFSELSDNCEAIGLYFSASVSCLTINIEKVLTTFIHFKIVVWSCKFLQR